MPAAVSAIKATALNPPIQFSLIWLIIGLLLAVAIPGWYVLVIWLTRRKAVGSINDLKHLTGVIDLDRLKANYLKLIEAYYQRYLRKEITLRDLHYSLSAIIRDFVSHASHLPASNMTLSDLKHSSYPKLAELIETYYPGEFAAMEHGDAALSTDAAKGLVTRWPS